MKYAAIVLSLFALASCSPFALGSEYSESNMDLMQAWANTASYEYSINNEAYFKSPIEFEADGGGDCEDFAAHLIYQIGPKASMVIVKFPEWRHAIVKYEGMYIEPQYVGTVYFESSLNITAVYDYWETMAFCTMLGTKNIGKDTTWTGWQLSP